MLTVTAAIIERDGCILAARRSGGHLAGFWEFPGGKLEDGEIPEECLKRELEEELGVVTEVGRFVGESVYDYDGTVVKLLGYATKHINGTFQLTVHDEIRWLPVEDLWTLKWAPADIPLVECIANFRFGQDKGIE